jgi:hypothetical protein
MKRKSSDKLHLSKETLLSLDARQVSRAVGGTLINTQCINCTDACSVACTHTHCSNCCP